MLVEFRAFVRVVGAVAMGWCHKECIQFANAQSGDRDWRRFVSY